MFDLTVLSFAKINLGLRVTRKEGKYHHVRTLLHEIALHDRLRFTIRKDFRTVFVCKNSEVPRGRTNTILKAVKGIKDEAQHRGLQHRITGLTIFLDKKIPLASGLGGGSSNAAATLKALNQLWNLKFSLSTLSRLASGIGCDIPFFLYGGTAWATHFGEKIKPVSAFTMPPYMIAIHSKKKSTKQMYALLDTLGKKSKKNGSFANDFEAVIDHFPAFSKARKLKEYLLDSGAIEVFLSGSGPAFVALYPHRSVQQKAYRNLRSKVDFLFKP